MATYKVIQDIEAEDHILGPLSLRQFIYALIAAFCFYLSYLVTSKHAAILMALFLPPGLFCAFFAFPFGQDQSTEVWALAKIRFYFKPRKRIWDQSGMKDLVSITVPKKVEVRRTDGLSQSEVRSRLSALANTIDSRGWAVKNVDLNLYSKPGLIPTDADSDRLINTGAIPQPVANFDVHAADDIMDAQNNPIAQQFDQMISASTAAHRQQLTDMLHSSSNSPASTNTSQWFMSQSSPQVTGPAPLIQTAAQDDAQLSSSLKARNTAQDVTYGRMKTIQPIGDQTVAKPTQEAPKPTPAPAAQQLATNNDLNISTLARVANKKDLPPEEEVIIPLH